MNCMLHQRNTREATVSTHTQTITGESVCEVIANDVLISLIPILSKYNPNQICTFLQVCPSSLICQTCIDMVKLHDNPVELASLFKEFSHVICSYLSNAHHIQSLPKDDASQIHNILSTIPHNSIHLANQQDMIHDLQGFGSICHAVLPFVLRPILVPLLKFASPDTICKAIHVIAPSLDHDICIEIITKYETVDSILPILVATICELVVPVESADKSNNHVQSISDLQNKIKTTANTTNNIKTIGHSSKSIITSNRCVDSISLVLRPFVTVLVQHFPPQVVCRILRICPSESEICEKCINIIGQIDSEEELDRLLVDLAELVCKI